MRVLIGCETSGVVREAFRARGHHAVSCDILPADDGSSFHIQNDVLQVIATSAPFDLAIFHPPCTYLCNSGVCWLYKTGHKADNRWDRLKTAVEFFNALKNCGIPKIAIENPIPHKWARDGWYKKDPTFAGSKGIGQYTQIIQPYQFGHPERKATCLWLKGLPKLTPTCIVSLPMDKKKAQRLHWLPPSKDRWKIRSRTFEGIAAAMAEQWG